MEQLSEINQQTLTAHHKHDVQLLVQINMREWFGLIIRNHSTDC